MNEQRPRIAITHGDTNGIGYELIFKTFADQEMLELCTPIVYGSPKVAAYHRKALGLQTNFNIIENAANAVDGSLNILTSISEEVKVELGTPTPESGAAALKAIDNALTDHRDALYDALVLCPADDRAIREHEASFETTKKYIETSINNGKPSLTMLVNNCMRVASVAQGLGIKDVAAAVSCENVERRVIALYESLRRDFMLSCPRIAVMSLNHEIGDEDRCEIVKAIEELSNSIAGAFGPYTTKQLFGDRCYEQFDAILAMYDDQATMPFQTLTCDTGYKYLAAMPLVCTTTLEGTRYDIAGQGIADETSFRRAIYATIDISRNRKAYDEPRTNPLPKLFHERRDDSEKARFSTPRKPEAAHHDNGETHSQVEDTK